MAMAHLQINFINELFNDEKGIYHMGEQRKLRAFAVRSPILLSDWVCVF